MTSLDRDWQVRSSPPIFTLAWEPGILGRYLQKDKRELGALLPVCWSSSAKLNPLVVFFQADPLLQITQQSRVCPRIPGSSPTAKPNPSTPGSGMGLLPSDCPVNILLLPP